MERSTVEELGRLAVEVGGIGHAMVLHHLAWALVHDRPATIDGEQWIQYSHSDWHSVLCWKSLRSVQDVLKHLDAQGYIVPYRQNGSMATWYTLGSRFSEVADSATLISTSATQTVLATQTELATKTDDATQTTLATQTDTEATQTDVRHFNGTRTTNSSAKEVEGGEPGAVKSERRRPKVEFLDYTAFDYGRPGWRAIRAGSIPANRTRAGLLIGAYLLGMQKVHGKNPVLGAHELESNAKLGADAEDCLDMFVAMNGGDELAGFNDALDYSEWWIHTDHEWIASKRGALNILFNTHGYRDLYSGAEHERGMRDGFHTEGWWRLDGTKPTWATDCWTDFGEG